MAWAFLWNISSMSSASLFTNRSPSISSTRTARSNSLYFWKKTHTHSSHQAAIPYTILRQILFCKTLSVMHFHIYGEVIASAEEVMFVCLQDYAKSAGTICKKLGEVEGNKLKIMVHKTLHLFLMRTKIANWFQGILCSVRHPLPSKWKFFQRK